MKPIESVRINHTERNYFNDYDELYTDEMCGVDADKLARAIDKLHRRYLTADRHDVLFVTYTDGTGYRLMHDYGIGHDDPLTLRHYVVMRHDSWDTDDAVTVAEAKRRILS